MRTALDYESGKWDNTLVTEVFLNTGSSGRSIKKKERKKILIECNIVWHKNWWRQLLTCIVTKKIFEVENSELYATKVKINKNKIKSSNNVLETLHNKQPFQKQARYVEWNGWELSKWACTTLNISLCRARSGIINIK